MGNTQEVLTLVQSIYDVALEREDWPSVIGRLSTASGGHSGLLRLVDCRRATEGFVAAHGYNPASLQAYRDHFVHLDPYRDHLAWAQTGSLLRSDECAPLATRRRTEYHNDYELPDDRIYALGSPMARERDYLLYLGLSRSRSAGPYDDATVAFLESLLPHVSRAVQIQRLVGAAVEARQFSEAALNRLRLGVVLLDPLGAVRFANRAALTLAAAFRIRIGQEGIALGNPGLNHRLQRLIAQAATAGILDRSAGGGDFSYVLPGSGVLQLSVFPFRHTDEPALDGHRVQVAVFLVRPGESRLSSEGLALQFGFTAAEARLAVRLAQGETPAQAADALSISLSTARTHLGAIFRKTGTRRQSELMLHLLTSLACLTTHDDTQDPK